MTTSRTYQSFASALLLALATASPLGAAAQSAAELPQATAAATTPEANAPTAAAATAAPIATTPLPEETAAAPQAAGPATHRPGLSSPSRPAANRAASAKAIKSDSVDTRDVAQQVAAISAAISAGQLEDARQRIDKLAAKLPPRSLTLLRLQAWHAHASGDKTGATVLYREIAARLPDDIAATINLAILEAGNGQAESARRRLRQLRALGTESRQVEYAIHQVEAQLR